MEHHSAIVFLQIALVVLVARFLATAASRWSIPAVLGDLLAGLLLGPSLLGWITPSEIFQILAEIGLVLLLFEVGLETDITRLVRTGANAVAVATIGLVLPLVLGFGAAHFLFDFSLLVSLFIGGTLTATSTGITVRILSDIGRRDTRLGQTILGAALIDDIVGVLILVTLSEFAQTSVVDLYTVGRILAFTIVFLAITPLVFRIAIVFVQQMEDTARVPGLLATTVVAVALLFAAIARFIGVPEIVGGFAAGLAFSRRFAFPSGLAPKVSEDFAHRIEANVKPIIHLFAPLFFAFVGLSIDVNKLEWGSTDQWVFVGTMVLLASIGKLACGLPVRSNRAGKLLVGGAMVPRGEVGLIFAGMGLSAGVLGGELHAMLVLIIALTTLVPPLIIPWLTSFGDWDVEEQIRSADAQTVKQH